MADKPITLIVDDEMLIRWSLGEKLAQEGFEVFEAESGKEARQTFANLDHKPVVVLLDIKLPDADGLQLLKEFKAAKPNCAVIMITAHGTDETARDAMNDGAFACFNKPFRLDDVVVSARQAEASLRT